MQYSIRMHKWFYRSLCLYTSSGVISNHETIQVLSGREISAHNRYKIERKVIFSRTRSQRNICIRDSNPYNI